MIIERCIQNSTKYVVARPDRVHHWLRYLFLHHKQFIRMRRQNLLATDESAIETLGPDLELAEVDNGLAERTTSAAEEMECEIEREEDGLTDATVSQFADQHTTCRLISRFHICIHMVRCRRLIFRTTSSAVTY